MKKLKSCLAALLVCLPFLCGCGMARDGYIEDDPAQTRAPMESPFVTASPAPTHMPSNGNTTEKKADNNAVNESPMPTDGQDQTAEH